MIVLWSGNMVGVCYSGAVGIDISHCLFQRLDGNAIMLSGYNRNISITDNEFVWLGESAVASWGFTEGVDATAGNNPLRVG